MKKTIRTILGILCIIALSVIIIGCTSIDQNPMDKVREEDINEDAYSEELASYFPRVEGTVLNYSGSYEYGHTLTLSEVGQEEGKLTLDFKGEIHDLSDGEGKSREERLFQNQYIITENEVREVQKNVERIHSQSVIREQVVLKLPIEVNNSWKENINIEGMEYEAETKIIDVKKDEKGRRLVRTETTVKEVENYPDNTYKVVRGFKEGKGISEFSTHILLKGPDEEIITPLEFSYGLFERE